MGHPRHSVARRTSDPGDALVLAHLLRTDMAAHRPLPADSDQVRTIAIESADPPQEKLPASLMLSANGVDPVNLAVEVTRTVPASSNLTVCRQQFWLGPNRAGAPVTLWADTTVVHLLDNGVRLKTVPSRLTIAHLQQLLADDGRPAWPPPIQTGPVQPGGPIDVDRLVTANGLITLAGQQHPIGYHLAGRRVTARIRDARPAAHHPPRATHPRRNGPRPPHETADHTFRIYDGDQVLTEVAHNTTKTVARFEVANRKRRAAGRVRSTAALGC